MQLNTFASMFNEVRKGDYPKVGIVLKAIRSCGAYSSAQVVIVVPIENITIHNDYVRVDAENTGRKFSYFSAAEYLSGGEPVMFEYEEILCVMGVK